MKIETLVNQDSIKISDLILEKQLDRSPNGPFDPRIDLSEKDKQEITGVIDREFERDLWRGISLLGDGQILFPDQVRSTPKYQSAVQKAQEAITDHPREFKYAAMLKILSPQSFYDQKFLEGMWEAVAYQTRLPDDRTTAPPNVLDHFRIRYFASILFPDREIPEVRRKLLEQEFINFIHEFLVKANRPEPVSSWDTMYLSVLRIVLPDAFAKENISKYFWKTARKKLGMLKKNEKWLDYTLFASYLTVIAAQEIIIGPYEFKVLLPEVPFQPRKPKPLPIIRQF